MSEEGSNYGEKVALSYHDCLLRNQDVDLLRGCHWLNDAIIGFYFEYLQREKNIVVDQKTPGILFVSPELTQLLKLTEAADYSAFLEPLNGKERSYVFLPLNNCESRDSAGGSHWSLLVYSRKEEACFHFDSCKGTNRSAAAQLARKIMSYLSESGAQDFEETLCPQQANGYDCGLFALCFTDSIIRHIRKSPGVRGCSFENIPSAVINKRANLLDLIEDLKELQEMKD